MARVGSSPSSLHLTTLKSPSATAKQARTAAKLAGYGRLLQAPSRYELCSYLPGYRHQAPLPEILRAQTETIQREAFALLVAGLREQKLAPRTDPACAVVREVLSHPQQYPHLISSAIDAAEYLRDPEIGRLLIRTVANGAFADSGNAAIALRYWPTELIDLNEIKRQVRDFLQNHTGEIYHRPQPSIRPLLHLLLRCSPNAQSAYDYLQSVNPPHAQLENLHRRGFDGRGVRIKVIDLEFASADHVDFRGRDYRQNAEFVDKSAHGTSVASVIIGKISHGVAPGVSLEGHLVQGVSFIDKVNDTIAAVEKEVAAARAGLPHAEVISLSINNYLNSRMDYALNQAFSDCLKRWHALMHAAKMQNIVIVQCAGNDSNTESRTAEYGRMEPWESSPDVLLVGAAVKDKKSGGYRIAKYSARGGTMRVADLAAPSDFLVAHGAGFDVLWGTSFATPYVASVVALMKQANPRLSAQQIFEILQQTCSPLNDNGEFQNTWGLIDPERAVNAALA